MSSLCSKALKFQSGIITWCGSFQIHRIFSGIVSLPVVSFSSLFLEFLLGACWHCWTNPFIILSCRPYWPPLSFLSPLFWETFPFYLPDLLFIDLLFLTHKSAFFCALILKHPYFDEGGDSFSS